MIEKISKKIINHNNDYGKLESQFFSCGYGQLVKAPYDSLKIPYSGQPVTISILIPCHNSVKTIRHCIQHISTNSYVIKYPYAVEVIVVDDGSNDKTFDVLTELSCPMKVLVIKQDQRYRSGALNTALYHASNDFILTCDSDMCLDTFCIEETAKRLQVLGKKALFVGFREDISLDKLSKQKVRSPHFWKDNRFCFDFSLIDPENMFALTDAYKSLGKNKKIYINSKNGINRDVWTLPRMAYGCLFACERQFFLDIGGYNETFRGWGYEDTLIGALAISMGKYIVPVPSMCGFHISHHVDMNTVRNTPNKHLYQELVTAPQYIVFDYIQQSRKFVKDSIVLSQRESVPLKKISQRKSDNYHFYLGEYRLIKSGKHYPKSLFYSGAHKLLLELFPNCIYSCFVHIAMKNFEKATSCFANNSSKEKAYLDSIDIEKLLTTANLWYSQGSVLLAFQYFSLYGLYKGFDAKLKRIIKRCVQKLTKKGNNEISWCTGTF